MIQFHVNGHPQVCGIDLQFFKRSIGHPQGHRGQLKKVFLVEQFGQSEFHQHFFGLTRS